jgi:hypothetical protein
MLEDEVSKPTIDGLLKRIEKLEKAVFAAQPAHPKKTGFGGATGGIRFLIENGFFNKRRLFNEVESELKKNDYHYSKQAIQMGLSRLASPKGLLVALREGGKKLYAKSK